MFQTIQDLVSAGGGTFDLNSNPILKPSGFWIGGVTDELRISIDGVNPETSVHWLIEKVSLIFNQRPVGKDQGYGFWVDDDVLVIEISNHTINLGDAINQAVDREQQAIYDCYDQVDLYIVRL